MQNRRRKYFINKGYQGRFIASFITMSLSGVILTISAMFYYTHKGIEENLYRSHMKISSTSEIVVPVTVKVSLLFFLLGLIVIGLLALYYEKKARRLVRDMLDGLEKLKEGRLDFEVRLGAEMEFPGLEASLNNMVALNRARLSEMKATVGGITETLELLSAAAKEGVKGKVAAISELNEKLARLEKMLDNCKLGGGHGS